MKILKFDDYHFLKIIFNLKHKFPEPPPPPTPHAPVPAGPGPAGPWPGRARVPARAPTLGWGEGLKVIVDDIPLNII